MKIKHYIMNYNKIDEGASMSEGAVAWDELTLFYKTADKPEIAKMEMMVKKEDWEGFKKLVYSVIGKKLKG